MVRGGDGTDLIVPVPVGYEGRGIAAGDGAVISRIARAWQLGPSRILPPTCRFSPSCSQYAIEALQKYGALKGGWMALKRLMRCQPWGGCGYDPVP